MSTFSEAHDPLDDMHVSEERAFFLKVKAALSMIMRSSRPADVIFKMYNVSVPEWWRFVKLYPEETEKIKDRKRGLFFVLKHC